MYRYLSLKVLFKVCESRLRALDCRVQAFCRRTSRTRGRAARESVHSFESLHDTRVHTRVYGFTALYTAVDTALCTAVDTQQSHISLDALAVPSQRSTCGLTYGLALRNYTDQSTCGLTRRRSFNISFNIYTNYRAHSSTVLVY